MSNVAQGRMIDTTDLKPSDEVKFMLTMGTYVSNPFSEYSAASVGHRLTCPAFSTLSDLLQVFAFSAQEPSAPHKEHVPWPMLTRKNPGTDRRKAQGVMTNDSPELRWTRREKVNLEQWREREARKDKRVEF